MKKITLILLLSLAMPMTAPAIEIPWIKKFFDTITFKKARGGGGTDARIQQKIFQLKQNINNAVRRIDAEMVRISEDNYQIKQNQQNQYKISVTLQSDLTKLRSDVVRLESLVNRFVGSSTVE